MKFQISGVHMTLERDFIAAMRIEYKVLEEHSVSQPCLFLIRFNFGLPVYIFSEFKGIGIPVVFTLNNGSSTAKKLALTSAC